MNNVNLPEEDKNKPQIPEETVSGPNAPETAEKSELKKLISEYQEQIEKTVGDPGQRLIALLGMLKKKGIELSEDELRELTENANAVSDTELGNAELPPVPNEENIQKANGLLADIKKADDPEIAGIIQRFEKTIERLKQGKLDEEKQNSELQALVDDLTRQVEKLQKTKRTVIKSMGLKDRLKMASNSVQKKIFFVATLILAIILAIQEFRINKATDKITELSKAILGANFDPENDNWKTVMDRAHEWQKNQEMWQADQLGWEQDRERFLREAREKQGELVAMALDVEHLNKEIERLSKQTREWQEESEGSKEDMYEARRNETRLRAELIRVALQGWLYSKIAAERNITELRFFNPSARRDIFAQNINTLLGVICDQIDSDNHTEEGEPRFWETTRKEEDNTGDLCREIVREELGAAVQGNFPFDNEVKQRLIGIGLMQR